MKVLWVSPSFLHPTDRGGQIRSLETLKELHKRHYIHYAALNHPSNTEGPQRAHEYCTNYTAVEHAAPRRTSLQFLPQLILSLFISQPLAVSLYASRRLLHAVEILIASRQFDVVVCDFLTAAPNIPNCGTCVLFQHNVETTIWQRMVERAQNPFTRIFLALQARRMQAYERKICRQARFVIAVSDIDAQRMKQMFDITSVEAVPTGVNLTYFRRPSAPSPVADLIFCGSMDWMPNIDAVEFFLAEVFPLIRARRPQTTFTIAGRSPDARVRRAAEGVPGVNITGSVPDMRPFLWGSAISIVPIRIGGGTRLKIYEAMAASLPVISTTIGAEGLTYTHGDNILIADEPQAFADACLRLLDDQSAHQRLAANALRLVEESFSWDAVTRHFEAILEANRLPNTPH